MGILEITKKLSVYALPGLVAALAVMAVMSALYWGLLKPRYGGVSNTVLRKIIIGILLGLYYFVVMGITSLSRPANYTGSVNLNLLSGYLDAWNTYSLIALQLIVFNIIMFIPLGVLLPLLSPKFRRFTWMALASFGATLIIETFQLVTGKGIFELDDLLHNTLGGIIGYHLFLLVEGIIRTRKGSIGHILRYLSIPLVLTVIYAGVQTVYQLQEFGNLSINPVFGTKMTGVQVTSAIALDSLPRKVPVYQNMNSNLSDRGLQIAQQLQKELGLPAVTGSARDGSNKQYAYAESEGSRYYLTYFIREGSWSLTNDRYQPDNDTGQATGHNREQAEQLLRRMDLLPDEAVLVEAAEDRLHWIMKHTKYPDHDMWDGGIMMNLTKDGKPYSIYNDLTRNRYVREAEIRTPLEAYKRILKGRFDQMYPLKKGDKVVITGYQLMYMYDSKGYYQPIYDFTGTLNNEPWGARIAALTIYK